MRNHVRIPSAVPPRKKAAVVFKNNLAGSQGRSWRFGENKKSSAFAGNRNPDRPAHSLVTVIIDILKSTTIIIVVNIAFPPHQISFE